MKNRSYFKPSRGKKANKQHQQAAQLKKMEQVQKEKGLVQKKERRNMTTKEWSIFDYYAYIGFHHIANDQKANKLFFFFNFIKLLVYLE